MKALFGVLSKHFVKITALALTACFLLSGCSQLSMPANKLKQQAASAATPAATPAPSPSPTPTPTPQPHTPFVQAAIDEYHAIDASALEYRDGETWPVCSDVVDKKLTHLIDGIINGKYTDFKEFYEALSGSGDEKERAKLAMVAFHVQAFMPNLGGSMMTGEDYQNYILEKFSGFFGELYSPYEPMNPAFIDKLIFTGTPLYDQRLFNMYFIGGGDFPDNPELVEPMNRAGYWGVFNRSIDYYTACDKDGHPPAGWIPGVIIYPEKTLIQALCFLEKNAAQYDQTNAILSSFEQSMRDGSFKDDQLYSYGGLARLVNYAKENPDFKITNSFKESSLIKLFEECPRVLSALASSPEELDVNRDYCGNVVYSTDCEIPQNIRAKKPRPGYFVLYIVPDTKADTSWYKLDVSNFTGNSPNFQTATCLPDEAQILITVSYTFSPYRTYADSTGKYKLKIMRAKAKLTAKNLETGAIIAESTLTASVQGEYRTSPGTLYESALKDADIEKFIAKVDKAMLK